MSPKHSIQLLCNMLSRSLGDNKAEEVVRAAAESMGLPGRVDRDQALAMLEHISEEPGLVGIAARFAKSRVHLVWDEAERLVDEA